MDCVYRVLSLNVASLAARGPGKGTNMEFQDKNLKCMDCGQEFIFTAGEQLFFHDKQFKNEPKRCKPCKAKRQAALAGAPVASGAPQPTFNKVETRTNCSSCGKDTTVPFRPTQGRPVFCRQCFTEQKKAVAASA
jgi:CxxC-x17-CxxC domain-containing protein